MHDVKSFSLTVEYGPSEFLNDRASRLVTSLPTRASINLYVNLDNFYFNLYSSKNTIIARLEINLNYSILNPPQVLFIQPDGSMSSSIEIVLNSSINFHYCYDRTRNKSHSLYQVPISTTKSPEGQTGLTGHHFEIRLSHYSPQNPRVTQRLQAFRNDSLDLYVNYTGECRLCHWMCRTCISA